MTFYRFQALNRTEISNVAPTSIFILPVAATEQHGLHLPTGVDTWLLTALAEMACQQVGDTPSVVLAPTLPFGNSHYHHEYGAALSLSIDTFRRVLHDLLYSAVQSGFRKLFIINGHGGNDELIRLGVREAVSEFGASAASGSYWALAQDALRQAGLLDMGWHVPGHAGSFETSLMMALRPELAYDVPVSADHGSRGYFGQAPGLFIQHPHRQVGEGGYTDNAAGANVEYGKRAAAVIAEAIAAAVRQFSASCPAPTERRI